MQARAGAIDELLASGALTNLNQPVDDIQSQLDKVSATSQVDQELAALKAQLGPAGPAGELPASQAGPGEAPAAETTTAGVGEPDPSAPGGNGGKGGTSG